MKILHVVEPLATGINTFILQLTENLSDSEHVILHGIRANSQSLDTIKKDYSEGVKFIHWKSAQREIRPFRDFDAFYELRNTIEEEKPDIVHLHSSKAGILGRIVAKRIGYKNVVYTPNAVSFLRRDVSFWKIWMYKLIEKVTSIMPGEIIASSDSEQDAYKSINVKSTLIYNGAKVKQQESQTTSSNKLRIVNCGVISTQKNPEMFNQIAKNFEGQDIEFIWVGDGVDRNILNQKNISITGWKTKKEVFEILNNSDIYLSTSLWEGLPLAGIEAMGSKLPLILNSCPGNNNLVENGKNGYLFQSEEEAISRISELLSDREKIKTLSDNSYDLYSRKFTDKICSENYLKLYKSIINGTN